MSGTRWQWDAIAEWLNLLPFVKWDRLVEAPMDDGYCYVIVYGWIDREDGRSDYVQLDFAPWAMEQPGWTTSSAARSREIGVLIDGTDSPHHDCQRVQDILGDRVVNRVR